MGLVIIIIGLPCSQESELPFAESGRDVETNIAFLESEVVINSDGIVIIGLDHHCENAIRSTVDSLRSKIMCKTTDMGK